MLPTDHAVIGWECPARSLNVPTYTDWMGRPQQSAAAAADSNSLPMLPRQTTLYNFAMFTVRRIGCCRLPGRAANRGSDDRFLYIFGDHRHRRCVRECVCLCAVLVVVVGCCRHWQHHILHIFAIHVPDAFGRGQSQKWPFV